MGTHQTRSLACMSPHTCLVPFTTTRTQRTLSCGCMASHACPVPLCNEEDTPDTLVCVYGQSCMSRTFYNDGATADTPVRVVDCPITQVPYLSQRCEHIRHARTRECVPRHACRIPFTTTRTQQTRSCACIPQSRMSHTFCNDENTPCTQLGMRVCRDTRVSVFCRIRRLTSRNLALVQRVGVRSGGGGGLRCGLA